MKKIIALLLIFSLSLYACGSNGASTLGGADKEHVMTWQEQYDLGVRYLSEGNYEEAIIAFTAAIEIDPKQVPSYVGRGDAYSGVAQLSMTSVEEDAELTEDAENAYNNAIADYLKALDLDETIAELYKKAAEVYVLLGDTEAAVEILERGIAVTGNESLSEYLEQLNNEIAKALLQPLYELFEAGDIEGAKALMRRGEYCDMSAELDEGYFYYDAGNGNVLAVYPDNFYYFGQWQNGQRSGHGMWICAVFDGDSAMESYTYMGSWENDSPNGEGNITEKMDIAKLKVEAGHTSGILVEISGSFSNGLFDGAISEVWYMNDGGIHVWSTISAVNGIFQLMEGGIFYEDGFYDVAFDGSAYFASGGEINKVLGF